MTNSRQLSYATRPGTWRHLGRRARLLARRSRSAPVALSWPVDADAKRTLVVRWPQRYGWANAAGWAEPIRRGIAAHVRVDRAEIPQPVGNIVFLEATDGKRKHAVAIDYEDRVELHELAGDAGLCFKLQFDVDGYGRESIIPGGYVSKRPALYRHARGLRELSRSHRPAHDVVGRFGLRYATEIRSQAIGLLESQSLFRYTGGGRPVWWGEYIDELSDARVCVDLPGRGELCYRLIDCLAVGACVVQPELRARLHVPLEDGVHLVRIPRNLDGLVEWCDRLVRDDELRARLQAGAADYFDRYLALEQLGAYYVDAIWRLFG